LAHSLHPCKRILLGLACHAVVQGVCVDVLEVIQEIAFTADEVVAKGRLPMEMWNFIANPAIAMEPFMEIEENIGPSPADINWEGVNSFGGAENMI
jgi:hypothetical protein